jgi:CRP/FNR family transcriptional regulator
VGADVIDFRKSQASCHSCGLRRLCLPTGLDPTELDALAQVIRRSTAIEAGACVFRAGDGFHALYAVRSGSVKLEAIDRDGQEQVVGFYYPADLLGLDAIGCESHPRTAIALEMTTVCEIPFERFESLLLEAPNLHRRVLQLMSDAISRDEDMLLVLGRMSAEERLARFLICQSVRYQQRGFSSLEFNLSMSRHDIGNYLGLAAETLSRLFRRFSDEGLLTVSGKLIRIRDLGRLHEITRAGEAVRSKECH